MFSFVKQIGKVNVVKQVDPYTYVPESSKSMMIFPNPNCGRTSAPVVNVRNDPIFCREAFLTYSSKHPLTNVSSGFISTG